MEEESDLCFYSNNRIRARSTLPSLRSCLNYTSETDQAHNNSAGYRCNYKNEAYWDRYSQSQQPAWNLSVFQKTVNTCPLEPRSARYTLHPRLSCLPNCSLLTCSFSQRKQNRLIAVLLKRTTCSYCLCRNKYLKPSTQTPFAIQLHVSLPIHSIVRCTTHFSPSLHSTSCWKTTN